MKWRCKVGGDEVMWYRWRLVRVKWKMRRKYVPRGRNKGITVMTINNNIIVILALSGVVLVLDNVCGRRRLVSQTFVIDDFCLDSVMYDIQ